MTSLKVDRPLTSQLKKLFNEMSCNSNVTPTEFYAMVIKFFNFFNNHQQHDAQEFLTHLLTGLQKESRDEDLEGYIGNTNYSQGTYTKVINTIIDNNSIWYSSFMVVQKEQLSCTVCKTESTNYSASNSIPVQVPETTFQVKIPASTVESVEKFCNNCQENYTHN